MTKVSDCLKGKCGCEGGAEDPCKFKRCSNCDYPISDDGKTLVDHASEDHDICPYCDGPLSERRIYGSLVD